MEDCSTHHGSVIEEVSGTGIEALISVEKLRGTDLCLGQIDAPMWRKTPVLVENSLYRLKFQTVRSFPVGPPCRARLDLVISMLIVDSEQSKMNPSGLGCIL